MNSPEYRLNLSHNSWNGTALPHSKTGHLSRASLVDEIFSIIRRINEAGTTILLVEQNAFKALGLAARGYIMETGQVIKSGPAKDLIKDDAVKTAYLGG